MIIALAVEIIGSRDVMSWKTINGERLIKAEMRNLMNCDRIEHYLMSTAIPPQAIILPASPVLARIHLPPSAYLCIPLSLSLLISQPFAYSLDYCLQSCPFFNYPL